MSNKGNFLTSYTGKKILGYAYGLGAAVVIAGALFKIMHWPGANEMLIAGMGTEVIIFVISAFEPPHMDVEWERVYPELADESLSPTGGGGGGGKLSLTDKFDEMLEKANIEQSLFDRLGQNLGKLGDNVNKMTEVADAAGATSEFTAKAKEAASALDNMKGAYNDATHAARTLVEASSESKNYHEQIQQLSKNLSSLNTMYELELNDANNHLKTMNKFYGNLSQAMKNMEETRDDSERFKAEFGTLNKHLSALNNVYGGMLNAMRPGAGS